MQTQEFLIMVDEGELFELILHLHHLEDVSKLLVRDCHVLWMITWLILAAIQPSHRGGLMLQLLEEDLEGHLQALSELLVDARRALKLPQVDHQRQRLTHLVIAEQVLTQLDALVQSVQQHLDVVIVSIIYLVLRTS